MQLLYSLRTLQAPQDVGYEVQSKQINSDGWVPQKRERPQWAQTHALHQIHSLSSCINFIGNPVLHVSTNDV